MKTGYLAKREEYIQSARRWQKNHADRYRETKREWWATLPETKRRKRIKQVREWQARNVGKVRAAQKRWRDKNV